MWKGLLAVVLMSCSFAALAAPPAARTLVLVRHGHYAADPAADPVLGPNLTTLGVAQARLVGGRLATERFDSLSVSPLQRARDTAAGMQLPTSDKAFDVIDDLAECTPPSHDPRVARMATPEQQDACRVQFERLVATYFKPADGAERRELLVCHGNVIRYLLMRALGVDEKAYLSLSVGHASVSTIRIDADGRIQVLSAGDLGHVPAKLRTGAAGDPERSLAVEALR